ncbi:fimbrial protein [Salmonella enterica]
MRNKIILAMAAAGMMCATSAFADDTPPPTLASGRIIVTGTINNSPCDIADGDPITVDFGQFSNKHLQAANQPANAKYNKNFAIHLENCSFDTDPTTHEPKMSKVAVSFSVGGGVVAPDNGIFPNSQNPGMAQNVGVQFLDNKGQVINITNKNTQQLAKGSNQINLTAQLVNMGAEGSVTPGPINIPLTYTLTYS